MRPDLLDLLLAKLYPRSDAAIPFKRKGKTPACAPAPNRVQGVYWVFGAKT